jgi:hypothetical protein
MKTVRLSEWLTAYERMAGSCCQKCAVAGKRKDVCHITGRVSCVAPVQRARFVGSGAKNVKWRIQMFQKSFVRNLVRE